jgi:zinc and cadmium transporter
MPGETLQILVSVVGVSALSFVGAAALAFGPERVRRRIPLLVALAAGALLAAAMLHLLPEAYAAGGAGAGVWVLAGLLGFFLVESLIHWHHHGEDVEHRHGGGAAGGVASFAWMNLLGDGIHNFIDGALIAGAWLAGPETGLVTTVAVALHEIPQEFGDFGVLLHGGMGVKKALAFNVATAGTALLGALVVLLGGNASGVDVALLPLAAGGFLYVACADLVPELHRQARERSLVPVLVALVLGGLLVSAVSLVGGHDHGHGPHEHGPGPEGDEHPEDGHDHDHGPAPGAPRDR